MKLSVILNTYNRGHLLELALASYLGQSAKDFEIIVADDGSTDETPAIVESFAEEAPFKVRYVRQEHEGHRRAAVLNLGLAAASGDWVLFSDCDSLAFPDLVELHLEHARPDRLLCGGYFRLDRDETEKLDRARVLSGEFLRLFTLKRRIQVLRRSAKARWEIIRRKPRRPHNMGLNYSAPREALVRINGYDEEFSGWGSADGDVRERLRRIAVVPFSLYRTALVMHMWHPVEETKVKEITKRNRAYAARDDIPIFCRRGLEKTDAGVAE
jgi:glycosyltransferase involved in cell wall biosynthesis